MAELRGANPIESGPAELICKIRRFAREAFLREICEKNRDGGGGRGVPSFQWSVNSGQERPEALIFIHVLIVLQGRVIICKSRRSRANGMNQEEGSSRLP